MFVHAVCGPMGVGKTNLLTAICSVLHRRGEKCAFVVPADNTRDVHDGEQVMVGADGYAVKANVVYGLEDLGRLIGSGVKFIVGDEYHMLARKTGGAALAHFLAIAASLGVASIFGALDKGLLGESYEPVNTLRILSRTSIIPITFETRFGECQLHGAHCVGTMSWCLENTVVPPVGHVRSEEHPDGKYIRVCSPGFDELFIARFSGPAPEAYLSSLLTAARTLESERAFSLPPGSRLLET